MVSQNSHGTNHLRHANSHRGIRSPSPFTLSAHDRWCLPFSASSTPKTNRPLISAWANTPKAFKPSSTRTEWRDTAKSIRVTRSEDSLTERRVDDRHLPVSLCGDVWRLWPWSSRDDLCVVFDPQWAKDVIDEARRNSGHGFPRTLHHLFHGRVFDVYGFAVQRSFLRRVESLWLQLGISLVVPFLTLGIPWTGKQYDKLCDSDYD